MSIRVRVDSTKLESFVAEEPRRMTSIFSEWREQGADEARAVLQANSPLQTGFLRSSIIKNLTPNGFSVFPTAPYSAAVEFGTKPHTIFPTNKKVLSWTDGSGKTIFAKQVEHPGFAGRFFIKRSRQELADKLQDLFVKIWGEVHG